MTQYILATKRTGRPWALAEVDSEETAYWLFEVINKMAKPKVECKVVFKEVTHIG